MKKQYVNGYGKDNSRKEKYVTAGLVGLCVVTLALTVIMAGIFGGGDDENAPAAVTTEEDVKIVEKTEIPSENETENVPDAPVEEEPEVITPEFSSPCEGGLLQEFSTEVPLYNATLDDWRVHMGIDISAPIGTKVKAIADGIVSNKYEDLRHGYTVILDHEGGFRSLYSNLSELDTAVVGSRVAAGTVISSVGDTTLYETIADTHLHMELMKDGVHVNPLQYFSLN